MTFGGLDGGSEGLLGVLVWGGGYWGVDRGRVGEALTTSVCVKLCGVCRVSYWGCWYGGGRGYWECWSGVRVGVRCGCW